MKRVIFAAVAVAAALTVTLTGCGKAATDAMNSVASAVGNAVGQAITGQVTGEVGKLYTTQWFDFTIESIQTVDSYAGYEPGDGYELLDVVITETGTFSEPSPMGTYDFFLDQDSLEEYIFPLSPLDDTMMPDDFYLGTDETVNYHMVYEVPEGLTGLKLIFVELDEADNEGSTFTININ